MACRLFGAKPLLEPMLAYCQLDPWEQISVKFESKYKTFHSEECIWKCRLWNWRTFCPGVRWVKPGSKHPMSIYKLFDEPDIEYQVHQIICKLTQTHSPSLSSTNRLSALAVEFLHHGRYSADMAIYLSKAHNHICLSNFISCILLLAMRLIQATAVVLSSLVWCAGYIHQRKMLEARRMLPAILWC